MQELHTRKSATQAVNGMWYDREQQQRDLEKLRAASTSNRQPKPGLLARLFKKK